ncbi:MAG: Spx/MgsR family RNA polymerase-binding regulatory protein [Halomonadaceae bacterium]|nr:MAG: Spx/MgsR family RNA polymerase-binding regulatory protein [Halomonadaceae bacterium]
MSVTLYGISNCDAVRKARRWLEERNIPFQYHDFRKDGITEGQIRDWLSRMDRFTLISQRSPTWKKIPQEIRDNLNDDGAVALLLETPTLIKRPLLDSGEQLSTGFDPEDWQARLG